MPPTRASRTILPESWAQRHKQKPYLRIDALLPDRRALHDTGIPRVLHVGVCSIVPICSIIYAVEDASPCVPMQLSACKSAPSRQAATRPVSTDGGLNASSGHVQIYTQSRSKVTSREVTSLGKGNARSRRGGTATGAEKYCEMGDGRLDGAGLVPDDGCAGINMRPSPRLQLAAMIRAAHREGAPTRDCDYLIGDDNGPIAQPPLMNSCLIMGPCFDMHTNDCRMGGL